MLSRFDITPQAASWQVEAILMNDDRYNPVGQSFPVRNAGTFDGGTSPNIELKTFATIL
jgi:hypothetical protein